MEPPHGRHVAGMQSSLQHNGGPPPYGSTFRPEPPPPAKQSTANPVATPTPPQPVRGGVQVLPPVVPPRGPAKTKPKPPVPPKRDQLTRLTTVKKEPIPIHRDEKDEARPLEALERKINESTEPQERTFSETIEHFERQGSFAQKKKIANYENTAQLDQPVYATINPETKKIQNSESKTSLKSDCDLKESSSEEESGATADIWVRAIDSPVKKPDKAFRSYSNTEEVLEKPPASHRASIDNSQLKTPPKLEKPEIIVEKDVEDDRKCKLGTESLPCSRPGSRATSRSSSPANFGDKEKKKISAAEALGVVAKPCPRPPPGKRIKNQLEFRRQSLGNLSDSKLSMGCSTSCPSHQLWSSFGECQESDYKRHERSRGQSADSRTLQRLKTDNWETQSYSSTLSRIGKYSTTKYFTKTSTCPTSSASSSTTNNTPSTCQDRPKSTCNCGRHSAAVPNNGAATVPIPKDVGKRTFSVEELRSGGFVRGSNTTGSARSSFGKSPRVTFALSEDEMGATGITPTAKYEQGDTRKVSARARSYDADDRPQSNRSQPAIGLKQTPKARVMDDSEIQETVESILGKGARVVDCEKKSTIREEEVLLVNGCPIRLEGAEGAVIRDALIHGTAPHSDVLNQILIRAGILSAPVRLETSLSVKSTVVTREQVTVARGGRVVDGRSRETKEDNYYTSTTAEVWEPSGCANKEPSSGASSLTSVTKEDKFSSASSSTGRSSTTEEDSFSSSVDDLIGNDVTDRISGLSINGHEPTIFGTVASDQTPKDSTNCRRSLPQTTPPGISNGSDVHSSGESNPSQDNSVMYREGNLVSGRLEALIQHMVPTADYYPDRAFLFAFLLTSRLFIKPHDLLGQILAFSEAQLKAKQAPAKERAHLLARLVQLLGEWSETFPYDFRDERVMSHVRDVAHRCVSVEGPVRQEVSLLLHNLLYRLKKLEQYEAFLHSIHTEATTTSIEALSQTEVSEVCGSAVSLAQQLTHIELERLSYIGPEEFVQAFAKESPALETSFKDMKQTRNLESYVSWFNRLSYFVATEVCKHIKSKKQRVRVVEFWVETARECFNIGNFNSLMAIIAGLNMSPVSRLKRTWSKVQCAKFSVLEHQMDPSCNFSSYRSTLKAAVWRSAAATDDSQRIVIPFFSLLVKDLYFLNEGCSNKLPNGHINFEKFWQLAKQVTEFITWKQVHCPFPKAAKVITYLQATPVLNEDALSLASFECEPPENHEKDRYKSLKADLGNCTTSN